MMKGPLHRLVLTALALALSLPGVSAQPGRNPDIYFCLYTAPPPSPSGRAYPTYSGLAHSTDRGATWKSLGWITNHVNDMDRDPSNPSVFFLATDYGVLRSSNTRSLAPIAC